MYCMSFTPLKTLLVTYLSSMIRKPFHSTYSHPYINIFDKDFKNYQFYLYLFDTYSEWAVTKRNCTFKEITYDVHIREYV